MLRKTQKRKKIRQKSIPGQRLSFILLNWWILNPKCCSIWNELKSEKEAFDKAMEMLKHMTSKSRSVRLDKYYRSSSYVDRIRGRQKVYVHSEKKSNIEGVMEMEGYNGKSLWMTQWHIWDNIICETILNPDFRRTKGGWNGSSTKKGWSYSKP